MIWYKHDANATTDDKLKKIILRHGAEGYAIFFHCLELITGDITKENVTFELKHDAEIIADNLKIKSTPEEAAIDKVNRIMKDIIDLGLFEMQGDRITCMKLAKRLDNSIIKSPQLQQVKKNMKSECTDLVVRDDPGNSRPEKIREDKKREEKNRVFKAPTKDEVQQYVLSKNYVIDPDTFFDFYNENEWHDGNNKPVKNWKGKVVTWNSRELKSNPNALPYEPPQKPLSASEQHRAIINSKLRSHESHLKHLLSNVDDPSYPNHLKDHDRLEIDVYKQKINEIKEELKDV
jgi:hypothetical protein